MKKFIFLVIISLSCLMTKAQEPIQDSTRGFTFEINYWFNMHHFLWMESFMSIEKDSTIIYKKLSVNHQKKLDQALVYYKNNLAQLDPKRDSYMSEFKSWITNEGNQLTAVPSKYQDHVDVLKTVSDVYKEVFWPAHKETCEKVLHDNIELVRRTEGKFRDRMTKLSRQFWQSEKIKVDITYYGLASDWNLKHRSYTTIFPTHVVMKAEGEDKKVEGNWLEILYHESTHHLILGSSYFVGGTIKDVVEVLRIKSPRSLSHAYHFYITGELTKQLLKEEGLEYNETYMQREGVFSWSYAALDKYLKLYMKREITLEEATRNILKEVK